jgi:hypothetical protein
MKKILLIAAIAAAAAGAQAAFPGGASTNNSPTDSHYFYGTTGPNTNSPTRLFRWSTVRVWWANFFAPKTNAIFFGQTTNTGPTRLEQGVTNASTLRQEGILTALAAIAAQGGITTTGSTNITNPWTNSAPSFFGGYGVSYGSWTNKGNTFVEGHLKIDGNTTNEGPVFMNSSLVGDSAHFGSTLDTWGSFFAAGTAGIGGVATFSNRIDAAAGAIISPAQITGNQNNYNPAGLAAAQILRVSSDATRTITGIQSLPVWRLLKIHNVGAQSIILSDASGSSVDTNQFAFSASLTLLGDDSCILEYDVTSLRWRLASGQPGAGGPGGEDQTPVLQDINYDNFGIDNLNYEFYTRTNLGNGTHPDWVVQGPRIAYYTMTNDAMVHLVLPTAAFKGTRMTLFVVESNVTGRAFSISNAIVAAGNDFVLIGNATNIVELWWEGTNAMAATVGARERVSDETFGSTWNSETTMSPSKNSIFDLWFNARFNSAYYTNSIRVNGFTNDGSSVFVGGVFMGTDLDISTIALFGEGIITFDPGSVFTIEADSTEGSGVTFEEDADNGANTTRLKAANSLSANNTVTLPATSGTLALTSDLTSPAFAVTNVYVTDTAACVLKLDLFDVFKVHLMTNATLILSNATSLDNRAQIYYQQDTNGQRTVGITVAGGLLQTNAVMQPTTNANALDLLEIMPGFFSTNLLAWWPQNFQPRVAFTNSLAGGVGGGGGGGTVIEFDGTDDVISMSGVDTSDSTYSVAMWIRPSNLTEGWQSLLTVNAGNGLYLRSTGNLTFLTAGGGPQNSTVLNINTWYHVVFVNDGGNYTWYINGVSDGTGSGATTCGALSRMGDNSSSETYAGRIGQASVYSVAITAQDVEDLFDEVKTPAQVGNVLAWWKLDDVADGVSGDAASFADSASSNTGTGSDGANNTGLTGRTADF